MAHTVHFRARLGRALGIIALTIGLGLAVTSPAGARSTPAADLAVDLRARGSLLLPTILYDVSVTNHGPDALTSATVTLQLDSRAHTIWTSPCTFVVATDVVTCSFGAVPVGATAKISFTAYYLMGGSSVATLDTTATRTASTPQDPVAGNDIDAVRCDWYLVPGWPGTRGEMSCPA